MVVHEAVGMADEAEPVYDLTEEVQEVLRRYVSRPLTRFRRVAGGREESMERKP